MPPCRAYRLVPFCAALLFATLSFGQSPGRLRAPFEPTIGQAGKDVMWAPTPEALLEKMLDLGRVTAADLVMDLGSGDGRNVIAAARRGARGVGVEFNPELVELSRQVAAREGVSARATFVQGDMFTADISKANVLLLFLLPQNLRRLTPQFLALQPGSRIISNTFLIPDWLPDAATDLGMEDCWSWCKAHLWIVPARVGGAWRLGSDQLTLEQSFQVVTGTLARGGHRVAIEEGRLQGRDLTFVADGARYTGVVKDAAIDGTVKIGNAERRWRARRSR